MIKNWKTYHCLIFVFAFLNSNAQFFKLDSLPQHDFIRYDLNKLSIHDSTTLGPVFDQIYNFEETDSGKVKILHIGDSHIQAGYFSGKTRECIHKGLGCGTRERGFVFPFGLAHTNGPINYGAKYTGDWKGFKSSSNFSESHWGMAGITAVTKDDSVTLKIYSNNHTFDAYQFNKIRLFLRDDDNAYYISAHTENGEARTQYIDSNNCYLEWNFKSLADTVYFSFCKDSINVDAELLIQGIELNNDLPGITYSEVGVNGAKVNSFLKGADLNGQLQIHQPDLIILSLGTNDAYNLNFNDSIFLHDYDSLITLIKQNLPEVSIILTSPGDGKRYRKTPLKENLVIRKSIMQLAKKHNCAVWDFFNVMGGLGSINHWYKEELTSSDFIHFNEKGYELQGLLFYSAFANAYNAHTQNRRVFPEVIDDGVNYKEWIWQLFTFQKNEPLFFNHYLFWVFFSVIFLGYSFLYKKQVLRSTYLFLVSLFFYYKAGGFYFLLLILSTVLDFLIGKSIYDSKSVTRKKWLVALSVTLNLSLLGFFKYSGFVIASINEITGLQLEVYNVFAAFGNLWQAGSFDIHQIILPVGISFYTFQTISYSVDIYRGDVQPVKNIIDFGFFVSFFPQLVAGPIVRANEFIPQIYQKYKLTYADFSKAFWLITIGLFKKMVVSDYLSVNFVDRVFESPLKYSGFENLLGVYGYAIQIYCDFSAYSDIAIGLGILMGFKLPKNFNQPYLSTSVTDFWRRWHLTLSRWLRDYLYIPLGGNRKGKARTFVNLFITMLLGGLWHGAGIQFIVWGALHGVMLGVEKALGNIKKVKFLGWLFTFHFVGFCWIYFRAPTFTNAHYMIGQIFTDFDFSHITNYLVNYKAIIGIMLLGFGIHFFPTSWKEKIWDFTEFKWWPSLGIVSLLFVVIIYQFKVSGLQPFIYFQF